MNDIRQSAGRSQSRSETFLRWAGASATVAAVGGVAYAVLLRRAPVVSCLVVAALALFARHFTRRRTPASSGVRRPIATGLLFALSTALSLLLIELGARCAFAPESAAHAGYLMPDARSVFTLRPGATETVDYRDDPHTAREYFTVSISAQGFRDVPFGPKRPGEFRILMLGDSNTMGYGVEAEGTIPKALERQLHMLQYTDISVVNAGVFGYGPWQECGILLERGLALQPDLVILQTFPPNDYYDSLVQVNKHFRAYLPAVVERVSAFQRQSLWPVRMQRWLRTHSRIYQQVVRSTTRENALLDTLRPFRFCPALEMPELPPSENRDYTVEACLREWYPEITEGFDLFQRDVRRIQAECRQRAIGFLAYSMPELGLVHEDTWRSQTEAGGIGNYDRGKDERACKAFFEQDGIPYVDVLPWLASHPYPLELYFTFHRHLRPAGNALVAEALAAALVGRGLIVPPPGAAPQATTTPETSAVLPGLNEARRDLLHNGGFAEWPAGAATPAGWTHDTMRPPDARLSTIERVNDARFADGVAARQTWRAEDGKDALGRLFGQTVVGLEPDCEYHLCVRAENPSNATVWLCAFEVDGKDDPVETLKLNIVPVSPGSLRVYTGTFFTKLGQRVRLLACCTSESVPGTVLWDSWQLTRIGAGAQPATQTSDRSSPAPTRGSTQTK